MKQNGIEIPQVDRLGEWPGYVDMTIVKAACKRFLTGRGLPCKAWIDQPRPTYRKKVKAATSVGERIK